jgi:SAM-dependent methyltransferase
MRILPTNFVKAESELISSYEVPITSESKLADAYVENRLCLNTGIFYNLAGALQSSRSFYADEYDLHSESMASEFQYFVKGIQSGYYNYILDFICDSIKLSDNGTVLDIGCGKGLLLSRFKKRRPNWKLSAIELSKNAVSFFAQVMPDLGVFNGRSFEDSPFLDQDFDLVMSNGVLEHVPDPFEFMRLFSSCLKEGGYGFIGVRNFLRNPIDLFTYDHLSRFTPNSIKSVFSSAGLEIVAKATPSSRVPMWYILKKSQTGKNRRIIDTIKESVSLISDSLSYIDKAFDSYNKCIRDYPDGSIAIYGTGALAFLDFRYTELKPTQVSYLVDDNSTLWGLDKFGLRIISRDDLADKSIDALVFSANPCYLPSMIKKVHYLSD